ncbi:TPR domain-containing protein [Rutstroemia sp. NJR-2017a WRK4]|nr:TPR domain-containing protein [Rutstroemia sp. NJR-2017a WRK4]
MEDLDTDIQEYLESLRLTPDDNPERVHRLESLGSGYHNRYLRNGTETDLNAAIQQFRDSLDHHISFPLDRLRSGVELTTLHTEAKHWLLAHYTASTTVSLISLLTIRSLETSDRQHLVTEVAGLASDAAAIALIAEKSPYEAIRLLELGYGIIAASLNELRTDIYDLQEKHPQLAEDYITLRDQLDAPTASVRRADKLDFPADITRQVDQRHNADQKLEQMIEDIRKLPGFERFLLAPTEDELKAAAALGPIVVINVSNYRCDALIIEKRGLQGGIRARAETLEKPEPQLLEWMWDTIGKPVLDALGFIQTLSSSWPRIWWIPTGPLTKFPLHAAGDHSCDSCNTVLDRVISSYSSSIRALIQSQQRRLRVEMIPEVSKAVLIGMEMTPGHNRLQYVPEEIAKLSHLSRSMQLDVTIPQTRQDDVLSALRDCSIFHFAGHGFTDPSDPSKSSLVLTDGKLTVASLFELNLHTRAPFLAYLSACGTGEIKHDILIDEALHLISACQLAGFRHVIGTLWRVNDHSCVEATAMTYEWMKQRNISDDSVAEGLHRASRHLRSQWNSGSAARASKRMAAAVCAEGSPAATEQSLSSQGTISGPRTAELYEDPPLYWVPYVHFGI